jgi:hypothetical protein
VMLLMSGCASEKWERKTFDPNGKQLSVEVYRGRDVFKDTKSRGWKSGVVTKSGSTAFSRAAMDSQTDEAAISAAGDVAGNLVERAVTAAIKAGK